MTLGQALLALSLTASTIHSGDPICIIGAGPAGLTVANRLQVNGYKTVIFDENAEVGGKCQAYYDDQQLFHPLGALLYSNKTYVNTLPIIEASGVPSVPFAYVDPLWIYDWTTGQTTESNTTLPQLTTTPQFEEELERYTDFWNANFSSKATVGYQSGVEGYTMSTLDWLEQNDYPLLLLLFLNGMVPYGYGDMRQTPILYMLTYFTPDILRFFAGQSIGYVTDFHQVFVQYAARNVTGGPIYLNSPVTEIYRQSGFPIIKYAANGTIASQNCSKLVLAFPPVKSALDAAHLDFSDAEKALFSPVGITKYWSGAVNVAIPDGIDLSGYVNMDFFTLVGEDLSGGNVSFVTFASQLPKPAGEPVAILRLFNQSSIATTYSWGKYRGQETIDEAKTTLMEVISKLNKDPRDPSAAPIPLTDADVRDFRQWDYFPHFDTAQLEEGYYEKLDKVQGELNTYYASGLNGFETVEYAIRAGIDIADRIMALAPAV